jgi:hypothetical protein
MLHRETAHHMDLQDSGGDEAALFATLAAAGVRWRAIRDKSGRMRDRMFQKTTLRRLL